MSLSVIIPAYNRADLLPATLRSLLRQTLPADEIIVVDDGSTDATAAVAESFGSPVRVIRQTNAGPAAARNRGWLESTGEFLHFFDSDDLALPNKQEIQMQALQKSGADIAYGPWVKGKIESSGFSPENHVLQQHGLPQGNLIKALLCHWSVVPHACLFRRRIVDRVGGFPVELFGTEDQLMFLRCLLSGARVVHSPGTLELYRTNDMGKITSASNTAKTRHHREWARFLLKAREECLAHDIDPAEWFGFRRRAWEAGLDLNADDPQGAELIQQLRMIHGGTRFPIAYFFHRALQRKFDGLQYRLTGARGNFSFQLGPISDDQWKLIETLFTSTPLPPCVS